MTRLTGTGLSVRIDGSGMDYETAWALSWGAEILRQRGAGDTTTGKAVGEANRSGSFACEADPNDGVQTALMAGPQIVELTLRLTGGAESYTFDAIVSPSMAVERTGPTLRTFSFEEVG